MHDTTRLERDTPSHSLIIPVYRNAENIAPLLRALAGIDRSVNGDLEVVFVIDGSPDDSGRLILEALPSVEFDARVAFHSRNFGSFIAIRTGLELAKGRYIAVMAADLQEPPELVEEMFRRLSTGDVDVVFGQRVDRSDPALVKLMSKLFWSAYKRFVMPAMPKGGVDIFGCNRDVLDAVLSIEEPNSSLVAQLFWVGFRRDFVPYARRARQHGESGWNFAKRLRYMIDSVLAFTDLPIMLALWLGIVGTVISVILGIVTLIARISGSIEETGYASIILMILFFGSATLTVQGILGCYIWRIAENTKKRPLRIISRVVAKSGLNV